MDGSQSRHEMVGGGMSGCRLWGRDGGDKPCAPKEVHLGQGMELGEGWDHSSQESECAKFHQPGAMRIEDRGGVRW